MKIKRSIRKALIQRLVSSGCSRKEARRWYRHAKKFGRWDVSHSKVVFTMPVPIVGGYDHVKLD
jgi:hypothetical protein